MTRNTQPILTNNINKPGGLALYVGIGCAHKTRKSTHLNKHNHGQGSI